MKRQFEDDQGLRDDNPENKRRKQTLELSFQVKNRNRFDRNFPYFRKPTEIGTISVNIDGALHFDRHQLKYFIEPKNLNAVNFDLRVGYNEFVRKDETKKDYIDSILRWILQNRQKFTNKSEGKSTVKNSSLNTDFVCWRGLLTKLLCTPYENRDGWKIAVTLFNGTYYLCEFDTEEKKQQKECMTERQDEMCYWGWKFEQYIIADKADGKPDTDSAVNNLEAYCTVIRSRLDSHSIVFSGEVDAIDPCLVGGCKYVEFKTTRNIENQRQDVNFKRFKLIKWWAQSFLVGISQIICGFRDDNGIVHYLKKYSVQQIPDLIRDIRDPWNPNICFNFLDQFFTFLKKNISTDDPSIVHLLEWEPHGDIRCQQLPQNSEYVFLPEWYIHPEETEENVTK